MVIIDHSNKRRHHILLRRSEAAVHYTLVVMPSLVLLV